MVLGTFGSYSTAQVQDAAQLQQQVNQSLSGDGYTSNSNIILTGHSPGGGLTTGINAGRFYPPSEQWL
jgi:hypothetical protein